MDTVAEDESASASSNSGVWVASAVPVVHGSPAVGLRAREIIESLVERDTRVPSTSSWIPRLRSSWDRRRNNRGEK